METPWLEMRRTGFLEALKAIKPTLRVASAPERQLQIGYLEGRAVFAVEGTKSSVEASGQWPGIACVRLSHFLAFLVAKPGEPLVHMSYANSKIVLGTARINAEWLSAKNTSSSAQLERHAVTPTKENVLRFKCPSCRRKQGVAIDSLSTSAFASPAVKALLAEARQAQHGFGCLSCASTWDEQIV